MSEVPDSVRCVMRVESFDENPIRCEPLAGSHVKNVALEMCGLASLLSVDVAAAFNGVELLANPGTDPDDLRRWYEAESERRAAEWRAGPEGRKAAREADERARAAQAATDDLMVSLPGAVGSLDRLVAWCAALSRAADHRGVAWDRGAVVRQILAAGYGANAHVGRPPEDFDRDPRVMGEWVVGQALDCMNEGMPPHPVTAAFAERYADARRARCR